MRTPKRVAAVIGAAALASVAVVPSAFASNGTPADCANSVLYYAHHTDEIVGPDVTPALLTAVLVDTNKSSVEELFRTVPTNPVVFAGQQVLAAAANGGLQTEANPIAKKAFYKTVYWFESYPANYSPSAIINLKLSSAALLAYNHGFGGLEKCS